jgi:uncharacterized membrane protein
MELKTIAQLALATLIGSTATTALAAKPHYVACYGVASAGPNVPLIIAKGDCDKLAGGQAQKLTPAQAAVAAKMKPYNANDYVACYGVAAVNENDCATHTSACGGSVATPRSPTAWVAIPKGICQQVKGGVVGTLDTSKNS